MFAMMRSGLVALVALVLAGAGVALLVWFLRWLWKQGEEETAEPVIEIKTAVPALEAEAAAADDEEEPASEEEEAPAIEEEPAAEVEEEAPTAEEEPPAEGEEEAPVIEEAPAAEVEEDASAAEEEPPAEPEEEAPASEEPPKPDDLKKIEGIGPKIAAVLQDAGITTYAELADADVEQLKQILEDADPRLLRLADPTTWPDQASLAAAGNWDAFDAFKGELKGGRR